MGSGALLGFLARNFHVLAGPLVTLAYPLYASVRAIESKSPVDDQQWLTYWVLYSLLTIFELTFAKIIEWLPFWPYAKLTFSCWLVLPYFSGAAYVYERFVRPLVLNHQTVNIWYVPPDKGIFSKPDDVLLAAEKFIEENGPEAFEKLINKAGSGPKSKKSHKRVTFNEGEAERESKSWKGNKHVRFSKLNAEKELKSSKSNRFVTFAEMEHEKDSRTWMNSCLTTILDDGSRYWN